MIAPAATTPPRFRRSDIVVLALCALVVGLLYALAVHPDPGPEAKHRAYRYYHWQAEAWMQGRLDLARPVPPALLALPDPYDPVANKALRFNGEQGFHDLSLYQGKFYMYWGPTPALVAYLPWRLITGQPLSTAMASLAFAYVAWLASAVLVVRTARQLFPEVGPGILAIAILGLAGCNWSIVTLARSSVWETSIFAACCFGAIAWWLIAECRWSSPSSRILWLALASASWGLAIGSRPTWIVGVVVLLWPLWPLRAQWRQSSFWRLMFAAVAPVTLCVLALLWLNFARFGSIFEFGQRYQLAEVRVLGQGMFSASAFLFNLRNYFFAAPEVYDYFPFVAPRIITSTPPGYLGIEFTLGLFIVVPYFWGLAGMFRRRRHLDVTVPVLFSFVAIGCLLSLFAGASSRYELELALPLALLTSIGVLAAFPGRRWARILYSGGALLLISVSTLIALLISSRIRVIEWRELNPHPWLGGMANRVATAVGWSPADGTYGVEMEIAFPAGRVGGDVEALTASGGAPALDAVVIDYPDTEHVRFHYFHDRIVLSSNALPLARGTRYRLRIENGAMLPPANHPFWRNESPSEIERQRSHLKVTCGQSEFSASVPSFSPARSEPTIGGVQTDVGAQLRFTGQIFEPRILRIKR